MAKNKEIELKVKLDKISQQHLTQLQTVVNKINGIQFNIGKAEAQKHEMLHDLALTRDEVVLMQDMLKKEYGSFDVNLKDGTINWPKDEK
mgnify:FL=1|jgi:hypothetical protein|tara:strand:- start:199 stop:468 length:270 start_codon:yes stop_codon:yes gene_type:complete